MTKNKIEIDTKTLKQFERQLNIYQKNVAKGKGYSPNKSSKSGGDSDKMDQLKDEKDIYGLCFLKYNQNRENMGGKFSKKKTTMFGRV